MMRGSFEVRNVVNEENRCAFSKPTTKRFSTAATPPRLGRLVLVQKRELERFQRMICKIATENRNSERTKERPEFAEITSKQREKIWNGYCATEKTDSTIKQKQHQGVSEKLRDSKGNKGRNNG